jgi:ubiquinone/menaquinone biosynthesis C-methylase UbiE
MNVESLEPYGLALLAYHKGVQDAQLMIRRDDGFESFVPVKHFFREEEDFTSLEQKAIGHCFGHVLDIGAGTGIHSLALSSGGLNVTAIDINLNAVNIMLDRGVRHVSQADVFQYMGGPYDTLLMLGHGIGIVEHLHGLKKFLGHLERLVKPGGQLLLDSVDVSRSKLPLDLAYHERNRRAGRYIGEISMQLQYLVTKGPFSRWLHIDPGTLKRHAMEAGWNCAIIVENAFGEYLAKLQRV